MTPAGPYPTQKTALEALHTPLSRTQALLSSGPSGAATLDVSRISLRSRGLPYAVSAATVRQSGNAPLDVAFVQITTPAGDWQNLETAVTTDATTVFFSPPVTLPAHADLTIEFGAAITVASVNPDDQAALDARGYSDGEERGLVAVELQTPRSAATGALGPLGMRVVHQPSTPSDGLASLDSLELFLPGSFEIVDTGDAPPYLRYRSRDGALYVLPMTPQ